MQTPLRNSIEKMIPSNISGSHIKIKRYAVRALLKDKQTIQDKEMLANTGLGGRQVLFNNIISHKIPIMMQYPNPL